MTHTQAEPVTAGDGVPPVARPKSPTMLLVNIQSLRAIAALMVVYTHAGLVLKDMGYRQRAYEWGAYGVDLFFVISGFIMAYVNFHKPKKPVDFMLNRFVRIAPLYWLVTSAVFALALVAPRAMASTHADLTELIKSLFFIPFVKSSGAVQPMVFVGWTLNFEMFFYLLFAIGLALPRGSTAFTVGLIAVIASLSFFKLGPIVGFYSDLIILEFAAGMLVFKLMGKLPARWGTPLVLIGCLLFVINLLRWPTLHRAYVAGIPAFLIVLGAVLWERAGIRLRGLLLLGDASYSIYLTHFFVTEGARVIFRRLPHQLPVAVGMIAFSTLLAAIAGIMVYMLIEKPSVLYTRRFIDRIVHFRRERLEVGM